MTDWIKNDDGGKVAIIPCSIHPEHAQAVMMGALLFTIDNEVAPDDIRQASICLTAENLHALAAQANLVAYEVEMRTT
jgi:hypothetical protein